MTVPGLFSRTLEVGCTIEVEHTAESLHAHVTLDDIEVEPGDEVLVHGADVIVPFGEKRQWRTTATVRQAGPLRRHLTRLAAYAELTELYEVGFSDGRTS